jgi:hypothetical protein
MSVAVSNMENSFFFSDYHQTLDFLFELQNKKSLPKPFKLPFVPVRNGFQVGFIAFLNKNPKDIFGYEQFK